MIQYRIETWQESYGERKWKFDIKKYRRVTFKRSKRLGWRWEGFVWIAAYEPFNSRAEALAAAKAVKSTLK